jgi:hypothetical protein
MDTIVSFFPSGRVIATLPDKTVIFANHPEEMKCLIKALGMSQQPCKLQTWTSFFPAQKINQDGLPVFVDRGTRVSFDRVIVTDAAIRSALLHAKENFGEPLQLFGDNPTFLERMARIASEMGLKTEISGTRRHTTR